MYSTPEYVLCIDSQCGYNNYYSYINKSSEFTNDDND